MLERRSLTPEACGIFRAEQAPGSLPKFRGGQDMFSTLPLHDEPLLVSPSQQLPILSCPSDRSASLNAPPGRGVILASRTHVQARFLSNVPGGHAKTA